MLRLVSDVFWNQDVWLPANTTWIDIEPGPDKAVTYTDHRHIFLPIPIALMLIVLRTVLEKYVYAPFGRSLGIKDRRTKKPPPNAKLEAAFRANTPSKELCVLAKQLDMSERQLERWWRLRCSQDKPSTLVKFCEDLWRCSYFVLSTCFGLFVLWNKPWLWDIDYCIIGYPHHGITNDVWWFYMMTASFYCSATLTLFWDVHRKDFWQMFVHHLACIFLLYFSWVCNTHRLGTIVLLTMECSEIFLEAAKAAKHANKQKLCDCLFVVFTSIWFITRLGVYPFHIIWSVMIRSPQLIPVFPAIYIFGFFLFVVLALIVMWTWTILQVVYKSITTGQTEDIRSSSEASDSNCSDHYTPSQDSCKQELRRLQRGANKNTDNVVD